MHGSHGPAGALGLLLVAERDHVQGEERAVQAPPEILVVAGVLDDAGGDERVRDLEQHGRPAAEERRHRRVAEPADDAVGAEVAVGGREALGVGPHGRKFPQLSASLTPEGVAARPGGGKRTETRMRNA
jgi:hypothetical protein